MATDTTYLGAGWIRTQNGKFDLEAPVFNIWDVGYALGMNCRYNGHTSGFYSVAEHSVLVSRIAELLGGDPRDGLLHDATEAYLSDIPAPFKQFLPDWRALDARLDADMRKQFGLPAGGKTPLVARADWYALFIEANDLIPGKGADFQDPYGLRNTALKFAADNENIGVFCWNPGSATAEFMDRAMKLGLCGNVNPNLLS